MSAEAHRGFSCFGGTVRVHVRGTDPEAGERAADQARETLLDAHDRLSRFEPESELSRLNRDPRAEVPATPLLQALAAAVGSAGSHSGGLVDATMLEGIERAGYRESLGDGSPVPLSEALASRPGRTPGQPNPTAAWRRVGVSEQTGTIRRPPGLGIDSGGIAKGLLADLLAEELAEERTFAVDCCCDIRLGGSAGLLRTVRVENPFGGEAPIHELKIGEGAVATSGIGRRCWPGPDGRPAHHILDPASGEPAFTGIVQATELAPTALLAEVYAKAALLAGPERAAEWLPHGGVIVRDGGEIDVVRLDRTPMEIVAA